VIYLRPESRLHEGRRGAAGTRATLAVVRIDHEQVAALARGDRLQVATAAIEA
jgi:hypothetical protein